MLTVILNKVTSLCSVKYKDNIMSFESEGLFIRLKRILPENNEDISIDIPLDNAVVDLDNKIITVKLPINKDSCDINITTNEAIQIECLLDTYIKDQYKLAPVKYHIFNSSNILVLITKDKEEAKNKLKEIYNYDKDSYVFFISSCLAHKLSSDQFSLL